MSEHVITSTPNAAAPSAVATDAAPHPTSPPVPAIKRHGRQRWLWTVVCLLVLGGLAYYYTPSVVRTLTTISTDDAYVNGHVTFVAPRVTGKVLEVFVDDNNRVKKGDLLVRIDPKPFQVQVNFKRAAVEVAKGDLAFAEAQARGLEALARSQRWNIPFASEQVNNQIALLKARVATLRSKEAILDRARADFERARRLAKTGGIAQE